MEALYLAEADNDLRSQSTVSSSVDFHFLFRSFVKWKVAVWKKIVGASLSKPKPGPDNNHFQFIIGRIGGDRRSGVHKAGVLYAAYFACASASGGE